MTSQQVQKPPLPRSQSSRWWTGNRETSRYHLRSRKMTDAKIRTETIDSQLAFESDAFAVYMPTTREPILDAVTSGAKLSSPSKAQMEAYQTYKLKAQRVREKDEQDGVRVPSRMQSYKYSHTHASSNTHSHCVRGKLNSTSSPRPPTPAGSFPESPPVPQHSWKASTPRPQDPRSVSQGSHIMRNPVPSVPKTANVGKSRHHQSADTGDGASVHTSTATSTPNMIKVRLKPRTAAAQTAPKADSVKKISVKKISVKKIPGGVSTIAPTSSDGHRSPSPAKEESGFVRPSNQISVTATATSRALLQGLPHPSPRLRLRLRKPRSRRRRILVDGHGSKVQALSNSSDHHRQLLLHRKSHLQRPQDRVHTSIHSSPTPRLSPPHHPHLHPRAPPLLKSCTELKNASLLWL